MNRKSDSIGYSLRLFINFRLLPLLLSCCLIIPYRTSSLLLPAINNWLFSIVPLPQTSATWLSWLFFSSTVRVNPILFCYLSQAQIRFDYALISPMFDRSGITKSKFLVCLLYLCRICLPSCNGWNRENIWLLDRHRVSKTISYWVIVAAKLHLSKDIFLYRPWTYPAQTKARFGKTKYDRPKIWESSIDLLHFHPQQP